MRKIASLVVLVALAASLTACSAQGGEAPIKGCTPVKAGSASDAVKVSTNFGKTPKVTVHAPVGKVKTTQRTVVKVGSGAVAAKGKKVTVDFAVYNGTTGKELSSTGFDGKTVPFTMDSSYLPGIVKTIECSRVGTRVVGIIPPTDAFKSAGNSSLGIGAKDEMVIVADVVSVAAAPPAPLAKATGTVVAPKPGFPTVKFSSSDDPTVTIPKTAQPTKLMEETLIKGKGAKVPSDSNVIVNYQLVIWRTGKVVAGNDTYASNSPQTFNTGGVVPGFQQAIEGQTVGSRVLVIIPPALGYGASGSSQAGIKGTDDLVFVIDILGIS